MPTLLTHRGFRIVIYPNDHRPPHVHAVSGEASLRIGLEPECDLISVTGRVPPAVVAELKELVAANRVMLLEQWRLIHERD